MATLLSEAPTLAAADLLASEADIDQLPSSPSAREDANAEELEELEGDGQEDEEGEEEHDDTIGASEGADDGAEEGEEGDDFEIIEDAGAGAGIENGEHELNLGGDGRADGTDADELAGEEEEEEDDPLGLGTYSAGAVDGEVEDTDADEELPTVLIEFEDSLFNLFAQQPGDGTDDGGEANAIPLKAPPEILDQPLSTLFTTLRIPDALGEFLEKDTHLVLRSPEVDLEMVEDDSSAQQVILQDFLDIHPTNANGDPVRLRFAQRQPFLARFRALGGVVNPPPAPTLSPTTAVSSWMSRAKAGARRPNGTGDDEADELDDDGGDPDGVLGEHHEPDVDEEGREAEWEEGEGDVHEHWDGEGEGEGEGEEEEDGDDDDVILVEDETGERDLHLEGEEVYDEGAEGEDDEGDVLEAEETEPDAEEGQAGEEAVEGEQLNEYDEARVDSAPESGIQANAAPTLSAWKEPASSAVDETDANGHVSDAVGGIEEYESSVAEGPGDQKQKPASLAAKRSLDELDGVDALEDEDGSKRQKL